MSLPPPLPITIRPARLDELDLLCKFQIDMCLETEQRLLLPEIIRAGLKAAILNPQQLGAYVFVAERDLSKEEEKKEQQQEEEKNEEQNKEEGPIAMFMSTREFDILEARQCCWFQSVYVLQNYRRRGIFKRFYQFLRETTALQNPQEFCGLRLDVDQTNLNAQKTYSAMGMHVEKYDRTARWTRPGGVEPQVVEVEVEAEKEKKQEKEEKERRPLSISEKDVKIRIASSQQGDEKHIPKLAEMIFKNAVKYYCFESEKLSLEKISVGVKKLLEAAADNNKMPDRLWIAENEKNGEILACVTITTELSDWRNALVWNFQNFSVSEHHAAKMRRDLFALFSRTLQAKLEKQKKEQEGEKQQKHEDEEGYDCQQIRYPFVQSVEAKLLGEDAERVDEKVVGDEGYDLERYFWMRENF